MVEKNDLPKTSNNLTLHDSTEEREKNSESLEKHAGEVSDSPTLTIKEPSSKILEILNKNILGFLYSIGFLFLNMIALLLAFMLRTGLTKETVIIIITFSKLFFWLLVIADISALIYWITNRIYKGKTQKNLEIDDDFRTIHGHTKLAVLTDKQKEFIKFYSSFGIKKLSKLKRVERITIKMLESDNFRQIEKEIVKPYLQHYKSSGVFQDSRDGVYIETVGDIEAFNIYAMQIVHEENTRNGSRDGSMNLFVDVRPARGGRKKMWWNHPYDKVLKSIALIININSTSRIISQLVGAYKMDKENRMTALQLAYRIAFSGVPVENKILNELFETIAEDKLYIIKAGELDKI